MDRLAAMETFDTTVALAARSAEAGAGMSAKDGVVSGFFDSFKTTVSAFQRVVARNVLGVPLKERPRTEFGRGALFACAEAAGRAGSFWFIWRATALAVARGIQAT